MISFSIRIKYSSTKCNCFRWYIAIIIYSAYCLICIGSLLTGDFPIWHLRGHAPLHGLALYKPLNSCFCLILKCWPHAHFLTSGRWGLLMQSLSCKLPWHYVSSGLNLLHYRIKSFSQLFYIGLKEMETYWLMWLVSVSSYYNDQGLGKNYYLHFWT